MNIHIDSDSNLNKKLYLDYNATTPLDTEVIIAVEDALKDVWGNPSSSYTVGTVAKEALNKARNEVAKLISANSSEIIFLSGGTEGNNLILYSAIQHFKKWNSFENTFSFPQTKPHIITTKVEHDSIKYPLEYLYSKEADITYLGLESLPEAIVEHIRPSTCLVTVMLANNETGVIFPIARIATLLSDVNERRKCEGLPKVLFHSDAAQAVGKLPVDVTDLCLDYMTIVGHKFYGPRIGAVYVRGLDQERTPLLPMFYGGGQERGYRPGTENTPMIVGLGRACSLVNENFRQYVDHMKGVRDYLEHELKRTFGHFVKLNCIEPCIISDPEKCSQTLQDILATASISSFPRLPNTSSISFYYPEVSGEKVLKNCLSVMASTGSACHSQNESHSVLHASGVCSYHTKRTIRLSVGRETSFEDVDCAVQDLIQAIKKLTTHNKLPGAL